METSSRELTSIKWTEEINGLTDSVKSRVSLSFKNKMFSSNC